MILAMVLLFVILAGALALVSLVCGLILLVNAFRRGIGQGLAFALLPPYALYWAFAELVHPRKRLLLAGWLGGSVLACAMVGLGLAVMPTGLAWQ